MRSLLHGCRRDRARLPPRFTETRVIKMEEAQLLQEQRERDFDPPDFGPVSSPSTLVDPEPTTVNSIACLEEGHAVVSEAVLAPPRRKRPLSEEELQALLE